MKLYCGATLLLLMLLPVFPQTFSDVSGLLMPAANTFTWGASAVDFDNDGRIDIYQPGSMGVGKLYRNRDADGFPDVLSETRIIEGAFVVGAVFGDYNNDGFLDVFFEDFNSPGKLYRNQHNRRFSQTNSEANLHANILAEGAGWADFNLDGRLDLFVANDDGANQLFKNLDYQSFQDVSLTAGVEQFGNSYGMSWGDFNEDGLPDIFITPCHHSDLSRSVKHLLRNNGDETFTNVNVSAGINDSLASWGVIWLDYNNDGHQDVYIANITAASRPAFNRLYRNNGDQTFTDMTVAAGVAGDAAEDSYGVAAADFDNDGRVDIYVANLNFPHRLYHNNGNGTFTDIASSAGISEQRHIAVAVADFNRDGWMDIFTAGLPSNRLLMNNSGGNHWLEVEARGVAANYHGIGARLEVFAGGQMQVREIRAGGSFCSQSDELTAHFGLGTAATVDSLICRWPGGPADILRNLPADRRITLVQGVGINQSPSTFRLLSPADGDTVQTAPGGVTFTWERAENAEPEPLQYTFRISGPGVDTVISALSDTSVLVSGLALQPGQQYVWTVSASDGFSVRAGEDVFQFTGAGVVGVGEPLRLPGEFSLLPNYPNPFNPRTIIPYFLPVAAGITLDIYNVAGQRIARLIQGRQGPGSHSLFWEGRDEEGREVPAGVYFYRLEARHEGRRLFYKTRQMLFLK